MLWLVGTLYLLLSLPVTIRFGVSLNGMRGSAQATLFWLGFGARMDSEITWDGRPRVRVRYAAPGKRAGKKPVSISPDALRTLLCMGRWDIRLLVGLEDAAQTAVAVGALRAALCAVMAGGRLSGSAQVGADFAVGCFLMTARCIIRAPLGDIILIGVRAARQSRRKTRRASVRKEGETWSSIPSRA